jgi:hypothetical protein
MSSFASVTMRRRDLDRRPAGCRDPDAGTQDVFNGPPP